MQTPSLITSRILMIRPSHFGYNEQTALSNAFQTKSELLSPTEISQQALAEFDGLVHQLRSCGVEVIVVADDPEVHTPDAVFPNNWVSFHANGSILTYPMQSEVRRAERQQRIIDHISERFVVNATFSLEAYEMDNQFLEGTGSMVLDRVQRIAYACLSPRTDLFVLERFCQLMNYKSVTFRAVDALGKEIYHSNVMMALGETFAIYTPEAIPNISELNQLKRSLTDSGKSLIAIDLQQMKAFAGNMLQVKNGRGQTFLIMSTQAYKSLSALQISQIETHTTIVHSAVNVIEQAGGGSVRCMMAEIFLRPKN